MIQNTDLKTLEKELRQIRQEKWDQGYNLEDMPDREFVTLYMMPSSLHRKRWPFNDPEFASAYEKGMFKWKFRG